MVVILRRNLFDAFKMLEVGKGVLECLYRHSGVDGGHLCSVSVLTFNVEGSVHVHPLVVNVPRLCCLHPYTAESFVWLGQGVTGPLIHSFGAFI